MKLLKILLGIVVVLVLALAGGLFYLTSYLRTPEFKQTVLTAAHEATGAEVKIDTLDVSLFSGVQLQKLAVGNPPGFTGNLLSADQFLLSYRLMPLLSRRVEIGELSVAKPVISLQQNAKGEWNYEKLGAKPEAQPAAAPTTTPAAKQPAAKPVAAESGAPAIQVQLSKLSITDGDFSMLDEKGKPLAKVQGVGFSSAMEYAAGKLNGHGQATIGTLAAADSLFIRQIASPLSITPEEIKLSPATAKLAGGDVVLNLLLKLTGGFKYQVDLKLKDSDMGTLLQEAKTTPVLTGKLQATTELEGSGGLPTITGKGRLEISKGQLSQLPLQSVLALLLQIPELGTFKFDECFIDYSLANNILQTPSIKISSPILQISGKGSMSLESMKLDHDMTLAVSKSLMGKVPKEISSAFTERADGFSTIDFHVSGPYNSPKTDIPERLLKGVGQKALQKGLQKELKNLFK